jgi:hypothetical protein
MLSSGTTAQATTSDTAVTVIAASDAKINRVTFINEGTVAGFGSPDAGVTWVRIPAAAAATSPISVTVDFRESPKKNAGIQIKRIASGSNMSGVYVYAS